MDIKHSFANGIHFFETTEYDYDKKKNKTHTQVLKIIVDASCNCESGSIWNVGLICKHLVECFRYFLINPKERLKVTFDDVNPIIKNRFLSLVRSSNRKINEFRAGDNESPQHKNIKEQICNSLKLLGIDYVCEAIIEHEKISQRADILIPELALVVEIAVSESQESLDKKRAVFKSLGLKMREVKI